jgi:hypothetical protein
MRYKPWQYLQASLCPPDDTQLVKVLAGIYSTPTPKGWPEPKKVKVRVVLIRCVFFTIAGVYIYTQGSI